MPTFTITSTVASEGSESAEIDSRSGDFRSADEAIGYGRRVAEELYEMATELALEFDYSQVAVYEREVGPEDFSVDDPDLLGLWLFYQDGIAWSDPAALRRSDLKPQ